MRQDADTANVQLDWDEPAERSVRFEIDQARARELNLSSHEIANYLQMSLTGYTITQLREHDKLIDVELSAAEAEHADPSGLERLAIPAGGGTAVPLSELGRVSYGLEHGVIWERDRLPTVTVLADVQHGDRCDRAP